MHLRYSLTWLLPTSFTGIGNCSVCRELSGSAADMPCKLRPSPTWPAERCLDAARPGVGGPSSMTMRSDDAMTEVYPVRRMEVFTGAGHRRTWSAEAKALISNSMPPSRFRRLRRRAGHRSTARLCRNFDGL